MKDLLASGAPDKRLIFHAAGEGAWFYAYVHESLVPFVQKNSKVELISQNSMHVKFNGIVKYIDEVVDPASRMVKVRILSDGMPKEMTPNASVDVIIYVDLGTRLSIPEEAVLFTGKSQIVFVEEEGQYIPRQVQLGAKAEPYYEIKEGLRAGEKIVANANFLLDSESRLKAAASVVPGHQHGSEAP
jgi:hypothetical protein